MLIYADVCVQLQAATETMCIEDEEEAGREDEDERRGASGQESIGGTLQVCT
jgi:hypothetical protein